MKARDPHRHITPLKVSLKDKGQLYAAYISAFTHGGMFVPSARRWMLGDDVVLALTLPESPQTHMLPATVAWITPDSAQHGRKQGVGVAFKDDAPTKAVQKTIEAMLGSALQSDRPNLTL